MFTRTTLSAAKFAVYAFLSSANVSFAQNTFDNLLNRAGDYQRTAHYDEARKLLTEALGHARNNPAAIGTILNNLGSVYQDLGDLRAAQRYYRRSIETIEAYRGPASIDLARPLNTLGSLYIEPGKYARSMEVRLRSLAIREKVYGSDDPEVAAVLSNLAVAHIAGGRFAEAESALQRALAIIEKAFGPKTKQAGLVWNDLGVMRFKQKDYPAAADYLRRAIEVLEGVDAIQPLANLASVQLAQHDSQQAEKCLRRALSMAEEQLGPDNKLVARVLEQYAVALRQMDRTAEAKQSEVRAKAILARRVSTVGLNELTALRGK